MKQFFAFAGLFAVLSVSAQQQPKGEYQRDVKQQEVVGQRQYERKDVQHKHLSAEDRVKKFDQYGLSSAQKHKVKALYESRDQDMKKNFDKRQKEMAKSRSAFEKKQKDFDQKLEKILDKKQFAQYKLDKEKRLQKREKSQQKPDRQDLKRGKEKRIPA